VGALAAQTPLAIAGSEYAYFIRACDAIVVSYVRKNM
jgi:hypothetical protein